MAKIMMKEFFEKYDVPLNERHALYHIVETAKKVQKLEKNGKDYEMCLKELYEMIGDFFEATA